MPNIYVTTGYARVLCAACGASYTQLQKEGARVSLSEKGSIDVN